MNLSRMELFAVAIYDIDACALSVTKELAPNSLVAARVALANYCIDDELHGYHNLLTLQAGMAELGLDVGVVAFMDS